MYLVEIGENDDYLDVPPQFWSWSRYQASTGHKINHSKKPNGGYTECVHPRFGRILCLVTIQVGCTIISSTDVDSKLTDYQYTNTKYYFEEIINAIRFFFFYQNSI